MFVGIEDLDVALCSLVVLVEDLSLDLDLDFDAVGIFFFSGIELVNFSCKKIHCSINFIDSKEIYRINANGSKSISNQEIVFNLTKGKLALCVYYICIISIITPYQDHSLQRKNKNPIESTTKMSTRLRRRA